ncbi:MAG TPA: ribosome biogenesis GTP-binding protein YsxC [Deltaproteobacteria bacterium]|nr:ribosome biogenesis GTP-binding protein YsxC [Deltaproteobacteria bacterium]
MRILGVTFLRSVGSMEERKDLLLPEVCFVGRSNVGKSSMLNLLTGSRVARTSSTPGLTRRINLYQVIYEGRGGKHPFLCSDFPGYGYARVSKKEHAQWQRMIEAYILSNRHIKRIIWLRDARRDFDALDEMFYEWARTNGLPMSLVLTKVDKCGQGEIAKAKVALQKGWNILDPFIFSSKSGLGKTPLISHIIESVEGGNT